jgi:Domain of unknown function (DUF4412)
MNRLVFSAAALALALSATGAFAGVVITQEQNVTGGGVDHKVEQTVMIQGDKQKMITGTRQIITDLDKGVMYVIEPERKMYLEIPFPPKGPMAAVISRSAGAVSFKKAGSSRKVAGYSCDDFTGSGSAMGGNYSVTECFATQAPGAKEFSAFEKVMATKLKGTPMAPTGEIPDGVPLASDSTMKMGNFTPPPGMAPEQADKIKQMMAKRPPLVSKTVVSKIEEKTLPADTFTVPAGYTKREIHMPALPAPGTVHPHLPVAAPSPAAK